MNSAPEDFRQLSRLLALKRHEQPPPRYFNEFSQRVIARLETVQSVESISWFQRLTQSFQLKPALASGFGVAAFGLLLFRLVALQQFEEMPLAMVGADNISRTMVSAANSDIALNQFPSGDLAQSSINPAMNTQPSSAMFDGFHLNVQAVSFNPGGN